MAMQSVYTWPKNKNLIDEYMWVYNFQGTICNGIFYRTILGMEMNQDPTTLICHEHELHQSGA